MSRYPVNGFYCIGNSLLWHKTCCWTITSYKLVHQVLHYLLLTNWNKSNLFHSIESNTRLQHSIRWIQNLVYNPMNHSVQLISSHNRWHCSSQRMRISRAPPRRGCPSWSWGGAWCGTARASTPSRRSAPPSSRRPCPPPGGVPPAPFTR